MKIFLDMDEVLVDFIGGACSRWEVQLGDVIGCWEKGVWGMVPPLGRVLGRELSQEEFWEKINGVDFWTGLKPHPWMEELIGTVYQYTKEWYIVTTPSRCPTSYDGKVRWLKKRFGKQFTSFVLTKHKHLLANRDTILIDDKDATVDAFIKAGGLGIVFPRHHNSRHEFSSNPLEKVVEDLSRLIRYIG